MTTFSAQGVSRSFNDGSLAFEDVNFELARGRALGIMGASGAGKSSLARALAGLDPVDAGVVALGDTVLLDASGCAVKERPRVQLVQQDARAAFHPYWTVEQVLNEAVRQVTPADERAQAIDRALQEVGLALDRRHQIARSLSGGEAQRLNLARALARHPDVLICDEPLSALDLMARAQVAEVVQKLRTQRALSIIIVSHAWPVVERLCDDAARMAQGKLGPLRPVEDGAPPPP